MKILQVATISSTINAFLVPHIQRLKEQGHTVEIACNLEAPLSIALKDVRRHQVFFERAPYHPKNQLAYKQLRRLLKKQRYDVIHTHTPCASVLARLAARDMAIKVVYTAHGFHFYKGAPKKNWLLYYPLERFLARQTDCLITMNEEDYQLAQHFKLRGQGRVYKTHGIGVTFQRPKNLETTLLRQQLGIRDYEQVMVFAGELSARKNQQLLIRAVAHLQLQGRRNVHLVLLGDGELQAAYKALVASFGLEQRIHLVGYKEDIKPYLALADVVVSASKQEGLPVNVMEAHAWGIPTVVTNIRGHVDLTHEATLGVLVDFEVESMADGMAFVLDHLPEFSPSLAPQFSEEAVVAQVNDIYQEVMQMEAVR